MPGAAAEVVALAEPGASSATDCRSRSTGSRSSSSRVMFVAISVELTSTAFTTREPITVIDFERRAAQVEIRGVAAPRFTVTSASVPRLLPSFVASIV